MKNWIKVILVVCLLLFTLLIASLHVFVNLKGKEILTTRLEKALKREVTIASVKTTFFANICIRDIEVKGLFKIHEIYANGGLLNVFRKSYRFPLLRLVHPEADISLHSEMDKPAALLAAGQTNVTAANEAAAVIPTVQNTEPALKKISLPKFSISRLIIKDGRINLMDKVSADRNISFSVKDINAKIENLNFTGHGRTVTDFEIAGKIPWQNTDYEGKVEVSGWINLFKKDIDAVFKISDIDGVYLYPYYSKWVDLEKARIEKAKLNFSSAIQGLDNDVTATCHLELTDIVRRPRGPEEPQEKAERIADALLEIFREFNEGKIALDFKIKTKMDYPQFGFEDIRQAVEKQVASRRKGISVSVEKVALLPANLIRSTFKGFIGMFKAALDGVFATGKVFSDTVISPPPKAENKTSE
ncbi:MAG: DUF748 domain-containing protein [Candidatus Omnitrophica bacterium]|nr:DUF748 domain-containing protein [Candidatus Omnitrophota bacterium]MDD5610957.1 DUF748 domain-containing protein [Candidatus Omnitrophota bacterium]